MGAELPVGAATWLILTLVPLAAISCTAFAKTSVVLSAVRVGLGAEALLPWSAVFALAVVVAAAVMGPVALEAFALQGAGDPVEFTGLLEPLAAFLRRHADAAELAYFTD